MTMARRLIPLSLLMALLAGCATQPEKSESLMMARNAVTEAEDNPAVNRYAPVALREAQETLQRAEKAWESGDDTAEAEHLAYLAMKRAELAQAQARRELAVHTGEEATQQRQQILMQSREQQAAKARQEAEQARREAEQYQAQLADAQAKLAELEPKQTERGLVLTLDEVLFPFDSAELKPGAQRSMDRLARYLQENPNYRILIEGHTDSTGDAGYNKGLSERRANAVRAALAQRGVSGDRLRALGLGESFPVADNNTNPGRAENRRVEVVIAENEMPPSREEMQRPAMARERPAQPRG